MRCSGLTLSGSDFRFSTPTNLTSKLFFPKPVTFIPTRIHFGSNRIRATTNDGVVAEATELSFYELLGIPESGSLVEIKQAYKQLARKYHPDVSPPGRMEEYTQRFIRVQEAYETLSDPRRRALYDRDMSRGLHLAFSARRRYQNDEAREDKSEWRNQWQDQLSELKRRSANKNSVGNMSWGAQMHRQRDELSNQL